MRVVPSSHGGGPEMEPSTRSTPASPSAPATPRSEVGEMALRSTTSGRRPVLRCGLRDGAGGLERASRRHDREHDLARGHDIGEIGAEVERGAGGELARARARPASVASGRLTAPCQRGAERAAHRSRAYDSDGHRAQAYVLLVAPPRLAPAITGYRGPYPSTQEGTVATSDEHDPVKPSEQRGGTTPDEAEAREKGEWAGTVADGMVPAELGGSDAPQELLGDDPELGSAVLGETTGSDEPATDEGIDLSAGDHADATSDGGPEEREGEPDLKDAASLQIRPERSEDS